MSKKTPPNPIVVKPPKVEMGLVQGSMPDSINEWFVAQALDHYQIEYWFQVPIAGGTSLRGGLVIDFVVFSGGQRIPVFVEGEYWHLPRMDPEHQLELAEAQHHFKHAPVQLEEKETNTLKAAMEAVQKKIVL